MSALLKVEESDCRDAWRDHEIPLPADFVLESGEVLSEPRIAVRLHGDPSKPIVAVAGGISAGRIVGDASGGKGWWRDYVGAGRTLDLGAYCVLGFDFLPNDGEQANAITTNDQARALCAALDALNVSKLRAFVGSSYGGMVALAFAAAFPERLQDLVVISAADRPHAFGAAFRGVQRRIVEFGAANGNAAAGVALARQLAMISYRTPEEFQSRFGQEPAEARERHEVCGYLISRGEAFAMDPKRYLTLSESIDRHGVDLSDISARALFVAAHGDQLAPPADIRRCAGAVPRARYVEIFSQYGHDAFLKEAAAIGPFIQRFFKESDQ